MQPTSQYQLDELPSSSPFTQVDSLEELGKLLHNTRKSYNIEISQVAADLRLKVNTIAALEAGDWSKLPGEAYGHGYIRQYAGYLDLSQHEAAECCQRIKGNVEGRT